MAKYQHCAAPQGEWRRRGDAERGRDIDQDAAETHHQRAERVLVVLPVVEDDRGSKSQTRAALPGACAGPAPDIAQTRHAGREHGEACEKYRIAADLSRRDRPLWPLFRVNLRVE